MKLIAIAAAALSLAVGIAPGAAAPAAAQRVVHERIVEHRTVVHRPERPRYRTHRVCRVHYRYHHRIRTCRTVRYR